MSQKHMYHGNMKRRSRSKISHKVILTCGLIIGLVLICLGLSVALFISGTSFTLLPVTLAAI